MHDPDPLLSMPQQLSSAMQPTSDAIQAQKSSPRPYIEHLPGHDFHQVILNSSCSDLQTPSNAFLSSFYRCSNRCRGSTKRPRSSLFERWWTTTFSTGSTRLCLLKEYPQFFFLSRVLQSCSPIILWSVLSVSLSGSCPHCMWSVVAQ